MDELIRALIDRQLSLACIDALGVDFASHLGVDNKDIYKGSLISGHPDVLSQMLDINANVMNYYGCLSQEVVGLLAISGKDKFQSDICLAFSGILSTEENDIYLAVAYQDKVSTFCFQLSSEREQNIKQAILLGIEKTLRMINEI